MIFSNKFLLAVLIIFLPGCERVVNWGKETFYQGGPLNKHLEIPKKHIRTLRIYDQFTTKAIFNVMWLSNAVKKSYSELYSSRRAYSLQKSQKLLEDLFKENENYISFYLLADKNSLGDKLLNDKNSEWRINLEVDGVYYEPLKISLVELSPEYKMFFGKLFNNLKDSYLIKFDAEDSYGNQLLHKDLHRLNMIFRSVDRQGSVSWCIDRVGNLIKCREKLLLTRYEKEELK